MDPKALPAATLRSWEREQAGLRAAVVPEDTERWQREPGWAGLRRVGGVDLSYGRENDGSACVSLVVLSYPGLEVLYEDCRMVAVNAPYVAGFLAFREVPFMVEAVQRLQQEQPELRPQVLLVDGNGLLHQRGFGVACHLGVLTDLPCVGVAKNLLHVDGLVKDELHKEQVKPDSFPAEERRYFPSDGHLGGCPWPCEAATTALNPCTSQWATGYAWRQLCSLSSPAASTGSQSPSARLTLDRGRTFRSRCVPPQQLYLPG
ncbi:endonuclease V isoform X2 [Tympanuchus pallidicinctus]|uniref:endonuclease V isoform X2 n=1 Tax=Tympanuchus pallidicinctus TaxID=109042 RepID=UPI002286EECA|nr:endonuclease V isoform X2 [Tympanuchus pallidicinctus]